MIGWNEKRPIRHFELIKNIKNNYYNETVDYVKNIKNKITRKLVSEILNNFTDDMISKRMKDLLLKFILDRRNKILEIYNMEDINDE